MARTVTRSFVSSQTSNRPHQITPARRRSSTCSAPTRRPVVVDDEEPPAHVMRLHDLRGFRGQARRPDRARVPGHDRGDLEAADVLVLLERAAQVAVREEPGDASPGVHDRGHAEVLARHLDDGLLERGIDAHARQPVAGVHDVGDVQQELAAQRAAGMVHRVVVAAEAARLQERHGQRIAQRKHGGGAGGGREVHRAGFLLDGRIEMNVRFHRERRSRVAGDRDDLRAAPLDEGQDAQDLLGLAGVRDGDHHVAGRDHAEVAVARFAGVHEERRRARRGHGGGDLAADVARLSHAGHDDAAAGVEDRRHRRQEALPEPLGEPQYRRRLDFEHLLRERNYARRIGKCSRM